MYGNKLLILLLLIAVLIRLWLFNSESLKIWLQNRLEISTPLTSWNRVLEGIYLKKEIGLSSIYNGDLVHELPMMLNLYEVLLSFSIDTRYLFVLFDVLNGVLIYMITKKSIQIFYEKELKDLVKGKYNRLIESITKNELNEFLLNPQSFNSEYWSFIALGAYLFNPFCIASCLAHSTVLIHNFILLLWFFCLINQQFLIGLLFLSIHANLSIYSGSLIVATVFFINHETKAKKEPITLLMMKYLSIFFGLVIGVFLFNLWLQDFNTRFIKCTFLFILEVPDLVPNLGVFWYFFTEMFDHFRLFYTYVFQFNVLLYAVPVSIRLRHSPIISILIQIGLISTLKSYPSIGETGLFLSLLPMTAYLFPLVRNFLIYSVMLVASVVLAPIMFYLWVGSGGGNANFYFAITLVYSIGLIFLIVDLFYALLKREFIQLNGSEMPMTKDGSKANLILE